LRAILQVFEPGRESVFLKLQERVDDPRDLVDLADHAARQLRKELGESERSLGSSTPLKQITSESPEAVNYYLQGVTAYERADPQQAAALFEQAVRLDAKFALAHLELGSALVTQGRKATALVAFRKAYDLKTRVTARESLFIEFRYQNIIGDFDGALATCRNLVALFPEEPLFQRNVAFFLVRIGAASEALPYNQRAVALDASDNNLSELIANTAEAGLYDEALNWHDQFRKEGYSSLLLNWGAGLASMGKGDYEKARANFENLGANPEQDRFSRLIRCGPLAMQGRFAEASSFLKGDIAYDSAQGEEEYLQWRRSWLAWLHVLMDAPELARQQTVELARLEVSPVWLSSLCEAAMLVSVLRDAEMGAQILDKLRQIARDWPSKHSHGARAVAEGIMSDFAGDPAAGDRFVEAMAFWPDATVRMIVAPWWRRQRNPEAALAALQPLADHPVRVMKYLFPGLMVLTWCEQARSLAAMSRFDEARRVYNRVLNHWSAGAGRFSIVRAVQKELLQLPQSKETRQHG
jgi:tetratricopeptide (TPR) repeat protein